ncbi:MAG: 2-hydroxyacid dehydrogenase, partial [Marinobacter sp.]
MSKPSLLLMVPLPDSFKHRLAEYFDCHEYHGLNEQQWEAISPSVRGMVSAANARVSRALISQLPALEMISVLGVGYDGVDLRAARDNNICVANTPDVSTDDIADLAMTLLLCAVRQVVEADRFVRAGQWQQGRFPMTGSLSGKRLGIVGLGRIGKAVASRAEAFGLSVAYTGRSRKNEEPYIWFDSVTALAENVDYLLVSASGGPETNGMIDESVLTELGPAGVLVNVARGSLVDEAALIRALREGRILAAGLDVFSDEPAVSRELRDLPNVVLTPHMASSTEATVQAMMSMVLENLTNHFEGKPV